MKFDGAECVSSEHKWNFEQKQFSGNRVNQDLTLRELTSCLDFESIYNCDGATCLAIRGIECLRDV